VGALKCPHCGKGKLVDRVKHLQNFKNDNGYAKWAYPYGYWDCPNCGRGWKVLYDGTMISEGATDKEIYDPKTKKRELVKNA
jgi:predicted RNA-binding Zn-ribbon protein involved in translation (DUF1610 family)